MHSPQRAESCRGLSPPHTPPYVPFMAYGGFLTFTDDTLHETNPFFLNHSFPMALWLSRVLESRHHPLPEPATIKDWSSLTPFSRRKQAMV